MRWKIVAVGKPALSYARQGMDDYLKRLSHYTKAEFVPLKDGPRDEVESRMLKATAGGVIRIALDERGASWTTEAFRMKVDQWEMEGVREGAFLIGGADGHSPSLRESCDHVLQLSAMTMQHELALVVLLEQLYRVYTIKRGEPYHR